MVAVPASAPASVGEPVRVFAKLTEDAGAQHRPKPGDRCGVHAADMVDSAASSG